VVFSAATHAVNDESPEVRSHFLFFPCFRCLVGGFYSSFPISLCRVAAPARAPCHVRINSSPLFIGFVSLHTCLTPPFFFPLLKHPFNLWLSFLSSSLFSVYTVRNRSPPILGFSPFIICVSSSAFLSSHSPRALTLSFPYGTDLSVKDLNSPLASTDKVFFLPPYVPASPPTSPSSIA